MTASDSLPPLVSGDFVPPFTLTNHLNKTAELQHYGGKRVVVTFLPENNTEYLHAYFETIHNSKDVLSALDFKHFHVFPLPPDALKALHETYRAPEAFWSDADGGLRELFGIADDQALPVSLLINENSRLQIAFRGGQPTAHLTHLAEYINKLPALNRLVFDGSITHAPVIMIQQALAPELCDKVLHYWQQGQKYEGGLGKTVNAKVDTRIKRRTDVTIDKTALQKEIDQSLVKRVLPELRKVGAFEVKYREPYKVGRYGAEDKGFYAPHRDTTVPELAYRRYSMSVGLSNEYEGGLLEFPEYGKCSYKLMKGAALVFPSALMHGIHPVTEGERFVMVSFMYGEAELKAREAYAKRMKNAANRAAPLMGDRRYLRIKESEGFYTNTLQRK